MALWDAKRKYTISYARDSVSYEDGNARSATL